MVPRTGVLDGKSKVTDPHLSGPVFMHWERSLFGGVRVPGVAQNVALYFPRGTWLGASHEIPEPHVEATYTVPSQSKCAFVIAMPILGQRIQL